MAKAADVKKFCEMMNEPFAPEAFGFVSQTPEIDTYIVRNEYFKQSKIAKGVDFKLPKYLALAV